jgi:hypothetical protein
MFLGGFKNPELWQSEQCMEKRFWEKIKKILLILFYFFKLFKTLLRIASFY